MFEPTRRAGLQRLARFAPHAGKTYTSERNFDRNRRAAAVSFLSPYIRHRLVSEREILSEILAHHTLKTAMPFVQEVFWRGYFKGWLEQRPSVWSAYQAERDASLLDPLPNYQTAVSGQTGIACFDHWCQQLRQTGYLHNHARMWFASIWIFTLRLPWPLGADFFLRHLQDADPASNTLSWRWVAGLHTPGKHYLATAENIAKFTDGRFQPTGQLNENAAPLIEEKTHPIVPITPRSPDLPTRALWLMTEEDCQPPPDGAKPAGVLGIVSPDATGFAINAVRHAASTANGQTDVGHNWSTAICRAAAKAGTSDVICAHLPVGPAAAGFAKTYQNLAAKNIRIHVFVRAYDRHVWPHTTKGFFKLKKQIPALLRDLDL
ncbi:DNA photolyase [Shimia sp. R10_1]|nr:DNA photolyase [Shimia sp. R10_1]